MSTNIASTDRHGWLSLHEPSVTDATKRVLTIFGTRPEAIKLAPVIRQLEALENCGLKTINVTSSQHTDLLAPFIHLFDIRVDYDLRVMTPNQTPNQLCARLLSSIDNVLSIEQPDLIIVQGDTTTALAGALAAFHRRIPVGHVEAGLRTGDVASPFPEEMNRRLITRLATHHFAPTRRNRDNLLAEGVDIERIFLTGNTVVDALQTILARASLTPTVEAIHERTRGLKRIVLTTHRRESFGPLMAERLRVIRRFVERHPEVALVFPVHPNPQVFETAHEILDGHPRIQLIEPLSYEEFITLIASAWLIVSDSGGIQEEAPTLGKPLLILRAETERPEVLDAGVARLVGDNAAHLSELLEDASLDEGWASGVAAVENPFGRGDSAARIASAVVSMLKLQESQLLSAV